MALSLSAEQKELIKIFKIEEQYIIPAYQRPYSWEYDHCFQLYNDLFESFFAQEDYFIGNIIIAKSEANKEFLEIIDGQQRLVTLLLLFKVLHNLQPELKVLNQVLILEDWEGIDNKPRIRSDIFEAKDGQELKTILDYDNEQLLNRLNDCRDKNGKINERKTLNKFELNSLYFLNWLKYNLTQNVNLKDFTTFLLRNVFLLPIELTGKTQEEANEKALTIFETINNRGMNLEDADIFKAKLYKKAKKSNEEDLFISAWKDFKSFTEKLNLEVDDVFRYYSHIIRGKEQISSSEINLREFFTRESYSPFELKKYKEILDDLFKINEILYFINSERNSESKIAIWLELVELYTNQYPKFAVVSYLFENGFDINDSLIHFLKSLVRHIYIEGSTTRIKFEIYQIIKLINLHRPIPDYYEYIDEYDFNNLGRLRNGYTLLASYLTHNRMLTRYNVDRIINARDFRYMEMDEIDEIILEDKLDSIGNYIIIDMPKRNLPIQRRIDYYKQSELNELQELFSEGFSISKFETRDIELKQNLLNFFTGE